MEISGTSIAHPEIFKILPSSRFGAGDLSYVPRRYPWVRWDSGRRYSGPRERVQGLPTGKLLQNLPSPASWIAVQPAERPAVFVGPSRRNVKFPSVSAKGKSLENTWKTLIPGHQPMASRTGHRLNRCLGLTAEALPVRKSPWTWSESRRSCMRMEWHDLIPKC